MIDDGCMIAPLAKLWKGASQAELARFCVHACRYACRHANQYDTCITAPPVASVNETHHTPHNKTAELEHGRDVCERVLRRMQHQSTYRALSAWGQAEVD